MLNKKLLFVAIILSALTIGVFWHNLSFAQNDETVASDLAIDVAQGEKQIANDPEAKKIQQDVLVNQTPQATQNGDAKNTQLKETLDASEAKESTALVNPSPSPQAGNDKSQDQNTNSPQNSPSTDQSGGLNIKSSPTSADQSGNSNNNQSPVPSFDPSPDDNMASPANQNKNAEPDNNNNNDGQPNTDNGNSAPPDNQVQGASTHRGFLELILSLFR